MRGQIIFQRTNGWKKKDNQLAILAKIIFPGKLLVGEESWRRSLPMDNWVMRVLSGECCETVDRIIRSYWFQSLAFREGH